MSLGQLNNWVDADEQHRVTYLFESPQFAEANPYNYKALELAIKEIPPISQVDLGNGLKKAESNNDVYYWYEISNVILLAAYFAKHPRALEVRSVTKNPGVTDKSIYATDLYTLALKDYGDIVVSDKIMSVQGLNVWKRLLEKGHKILAYDMSDTGVGPFKIDTVNDLEKYFGNDNEFSNYRYVLHEDADKRAFTYGGFLIYHMKQGMKRKTL